MKQITEDKENAPLKSVQYSKSNHKFQAQNPFGRNINPNSVNQFDKNGMTLLYKTVKSGHLDQVKYLVEKCKADINLGKQSGKTPLYKAIIESGMTPNCLKIAEYLISKGASNTAYKGKTPLELAAMNCLIGVLKKFENNGYDFTPEIGSPTVIDLILNSRTTEARITVALDSIPKNRLDDILQKTTINWDSPNIYNKEKLKQTFYEFINKNNINYAEPQEVIITGNDDHT